MLAVDKLNAERHVPSVARRCIYMLLQVLPAGVLNILTGPGSSLGDAMVQHPLVDKVGDAVHQWYHSVVFVEGESCRSLVACDVQLVLHVWCLVWNVVTLVTVPLSCQPCHS